MGKYKRYWKESVVPAVRRYRQYKSDNSEQARIIVEAVERALDEYENEDDGQLKRRAIFMVMIDRTHTQYGAAVTLNSSRRTIQRWVDDFIIRVAKYAGYIGA